MQPGSTDPSGGEDQPTAVQATTTTEEAVAELQRLRELLQQRDCEISIHTTYYNTDMRMLDQFCEQEMSLVVVGPIL